MTHGQEVADKVGLVPVLRAGLGMANAMLDAFPEAVVWHLGLYRDHVTHQPIAYYNKLPGEPNIDIGLVVDPMLATANSAIAAIDKLKGRGANNLRFVCLLAAPEGIKRFTDAHPDVPVFTAAIDSHLNEKGYIVPGLGDAGDRMYGTK